MARHLSLSCDNCGKKQGPKVDIVPAVTRREDGIRYTVDLCQSCWNKVQDEFGFTEHAKPARNKFKVYEDIDQITS